jgi:aspartate/methionine/tyrosine aminotransferase
MESKNFAVGFRIEHSAKDINASQYGEKYATVKGVPTADYKIVSHATDKGVFTFCMCPGGYVMPSSSEKGGLVVNGMSKAYSMTGWRIGYVAAPTKVAKAISSMQSHTTSNACSIAQYASVTALENGAEFIDEMQKTFDERRKFMYEKLCKIDGITCPEPKGAFYAFINVSKLYGKTFDGEVVNSSMAFATHTATKVVILPMLSISKFPFTL